MILCCGEALFDVFVGDDVGLEKLQMEAVAGGSPFNVAIGIARLEGRSALLTGMSRDIFGERLSSILATENVSTRYLVRSGNRTTLSMVGLDEFGQPAYVFYGLGSADCSVTPDELPEIGEEVRALHFGSYSLVARPVADAFSNLLTNSGNRFVSVDPNVRPTVEPNLDIWRDRVGEYAARADLLKISMEDFDILFPGGGVEEMASTWLEKGVRLVVVTDGGKQVIARTKQGLEVRLTPSPTTIVDTVGAGDSFQAALLSRLSELGGGDLSKAVDDLNEERLSRLVSYAVAAARITCGRRGADLPRTKDMVL